jgi:TrmH family RNA methyltransferase
VSDGEAGLAGLARLSRHSPTVARLARWQRDGAERRRDGVAIVESLRALSAAISAQAAVELVLLRAEGRPEGVLEAAVRAAEEAGARCVVVERPVFERLASTSSPQGVIAVVKRPAWSLALLAARSETLLVLDGVADPGNVGTLVRSAAAAGLGGVVVCRPSADPFGAKAVRASAGALWQVPVAEAEGAAAALEVLRRAGFACFGTSPRAGCTPCALPDRGPVAVVLGSEAHGTTPAVAAGIDGWVRVPMAPGVESLNVAMAGTLVAFALAWRRSTSPLASGDDVDQH